MNRAVRLDNGFCSRFVLAQSEESAAGNFPLDDVRSMDRRLHAVREGFK